LAAPNTATKGVKEGTADEFCETTALEKRFLALNPAQLQWRINQLVRHLWQLARAGKVETVLVPPD
jgi:hypothetical protein